MPTETKLPDVQVDVKKETTELLDNNGNTLKRDNALADIFDKIEGGTPTKEAIAEVMADKPVEKAEKKAEVEQVSEEMRIAAEKTAKDRELEKSDLNKAFDNKQKEKEGQAPNPKEEVKTEEEVPEEELQVLAHDKPKTARRIQALWKKAEDAKSEVVRTKAEVKEKADKLAELEKKLSEVKTTDPVVDEAVKKQLEDLSMLRRRYELDKDPEVKSRFDDRITSAEKPIADLLVRNGAGQGLVDIIKEEGGWLKFSSSNRPIALKDGQTPASEVANLILQNLSFADRRTIEAISTEQITTSRERERFFADQIKTANDYFKKVEDDRNRGSVEYQQQVKAAKETVDSFIKETKEKNDWLKEKAVPASATAEQKAAIEDDNKFTKQLNDNLVKAVSVKDIPGMLEVVLESVKYHQERRVHAKVLATLTAKDKEIERLQSEITKFKNASKSVPRNGSLSSNSNGDVSSKKKPESLEEALDAIIAGGQEE